MSNKVLGRSQLDYAETLRQTTAFLQRCALDVRNDLAHVEFLQRGSTTRMVIRARVPGEPFPEKAEAVDFLAGIATRLERNEPCGKLTIQPNGQTTEITVQESTN